MGLIGNDTCRCLRECPNLLESVRVLSQTQIAVTESAPLGQRPSTPSGWVPTPRPRSRRNAKGSLEDNTAWYGQEKKKFCFSIAVCLCLLPSVCLSHHRRFNPYREVGELYSYKEVLSTFSLYIHSLLMGIQHLLRITILNTNNS